THQTRKLAAITAVMLGATAVAIWASRSRGPEGLAAAVALTNLTLLVPRLWWATEGTSVRLRDYGAAFIGPLAVGAVFAGGLLTGRALTLGSDAAIQLAAAGGIGLAAVALLALVWPQLRAELIFLWQHLPFRLNR